MNNALRELEESRLRLQEQAVSNSEEKAVLQTQHSQLTELLNERQTELDSVEETCRNLNRQLREVREDNEASARIHSQHLDQLQADKGRLEQLLAGSTADSKLLRDQSNRSMMDHRSDMQQLRLDLENERGRCAELSSEKAKLVIELDSVTRRVERMEMELDAAKTGETTVRNDLSKKQDECSQQRQQLAVLNQEKQAAERKADECGRQMATADGKMAEMAQELHTSLQSLMEISRDRNTAHDRAVKLQETSDVLTTERDMLSEKLLELEARVDEAARAALAEDARRTLLLKDELEVAKSNNASLKKAADAATKRCTEVEQKNFEITPQIQMLRSKLELTETKMRSVQGQNDHFQQSANEAQELVKVERETSRARQEALEAAEKHGHLCNVAREVLEGQLSEMNVAYAEALSARRTFETEAVAARREASKATELSREAAESSSRHEQAMVEAEKAEKLAAEVVALRSQLSDLRMHMAKADFEGTQRDDVERVGRAGEQMYERVIKRLREELTDEGAERRRLQAQLNEALEEAATARELHEQVKMLTMTNERRQQDHNRMSEAAERLRADEIILAQDKESAERESQKTREVQVRKSGS